MKTSLKMTAPEVEIGTRLRAVKDHRIRLEGPAPEGDYFEAQYVVTRSTRKGATLEVQFHSSETPDVFPVATLCRWSGNCWEADRGLFLLYPMSTRGAESREIRLDLEQAAV